MGGEYKPRGWSREGCVGGWAGWWHPKVEFVTPRFLGGEGSKHFSNLFVSAARIRVYEFVSLYALTGGSKRAALEFTVDAT